MRGYPGSEGNSSELNVQASIDFEVHITYKESLLWYNYVQFRRNKYIDQILKLANIFWNTSQIFENILNFCDLKTKDSVMITVHVNM